MKAFFKFEFNLFDLVNVYCFVPDFKLFYDYLVLIYFWTNVYMVGCEKKKTFCTWYIGITAVLPGFP